MHCKIELVDRLADCGSSGGGLHAVDHANNAIYSAAANVQAGDGRGGKMRGGK